MNPFPLILAAFRRSRLSAIVFICVIAMTVALGIAISAQERALRKGSGAAADGFDLIVSAPGSHTDTLFSVVYLDPTAGGLLEPAILARLLEEERAELVAPVGFGDSYRGDQVVGTTADLVVHLGGGQDGDLADGRVFANQNEAVVGALSPLRIGEVIEVAHGDASQFEDADHAVQTADIRHDEHGHDGDHEHDDGHGHDDDHAHDGEADHAVDDHAGDHGHDDAHRHDPVTVVGRMHPTGTPWDRAIVVPIEYTWFVHNLPLGHSAAEADRIGPPFAAAYLPGVPAVVIKPTNYAAAYDLRGRYRAEGSTAFFPAEILVELYALLGDAARIMSALTLAAQVLVIVAILAGLLAVLDLQRQRFAVLRALGAPGSYVFLTVWLYVWLLVMAGTLLGLPLGLAVAQFVSGLITTGTGIVMQPEIHLPELRLVGWLIGLSLILAIAPALLIYRRPVVEALR